MSILIGNIPQIGIVFFFIVRTLSKRIIHHFYHDTFGSDPFLQL